MKAVWKFPVSPLTDVVEMPQGARILHAHEQNGAVCVWAEVDPAAPIARRRVLVVPTGIPRVEGAYVGTVHVHGGALVFHVYDDGEL